MSKLPEELSDKAIILYLSFFMNPRNTLRFGGDGAENEMTEDARAALNELVEAEAVQETEPDCVWKNREHYVGGPVDLRPELQKRAGDDVFKFIEANNFKTFQKVSEQSPSPKM